MNKVVLLDTSTLGMVSNPNDTPANRECREWALNLSQKGTCVCVPEISDYETRRELIRCNKGQGLAELDYVLSLFRYEPLCTEAMRCAAQLWADAHLVFGRAVTENPKLDADIILCGQAKVIERNEQIKVVVATDNVRHFVAFVAADEWQNIDP